MKKLFLAFMICILLVPMAEAIDKEDHPVIKPIPGSQMTAYKYNNFAEFTYFFDNEDGDREIQKVKGRYWKITYDLLVGASESRVLQFFKRSAIEKRGKILLESGNKLTFTIPGINSAKTWCQLTVFNDGETYELRITEEPVFIRKPYYTAEEIKAELDRTGFVMIHEINFAKNSFALTDGSEKILSEFVRMMNMYPSLKLEIQGHTDNTGTREYNRNLALKRAQAIKDYIVLYNIEPSRMTIKSYGEERPFAANDTASGRALNRRVEFHVRN